MRRPLMSRLHENTIPSLHVQADPGMRPGPEDGESLHGRERASSTINLIPAVATRLT